MSRGSRQAFLFGHHLEKAKLNTNADCEVQDRLEVLAISIQVFPRH
jgi:hypothetical protein